jgi:competence protein ComEC
MFINRFVIISFIVYIFFIIFLNYFGYFSGHNNTNLKTFENKRVQLVGQIVSFNKFFFGKKSFIIKTCKVNNKNIKEKIFAQIFCNKRVEFGSKVILKGTLSPIYNKKFFSQLTNKNIYYIIKIYNFSDCIKIHRGGFVKSSIYNLRMLIISRLQNINVGFAGRLLPAIFFGDKTFLLKQESDSLKKSGLSHILAVSGLHIGFIVLIIFFFFNKTKTTTHILVISISFIYMALVGFSVSCIRATALVNFSIMAYFLQREYKPLYSLLIIAYIFLIVSPKSLFDMSFQFSFVATASIFIFSRHINKKISFLNKKLANLVAINCSVYIGLLPFMIFYFKRINILAILINLIIMPLVGTIFVFGILSFFVSFISIGIAKVISEITWLASCLIINVCDVVSKTDWAFISFR